MSNQSAAATALDALGDPMRRRLLELLHTGPRPVGELAAQLPIGRPAVSKHLRVLEGAGLVEHRSHGTRNLYALAPDGLAGVQQWLVGVWDTALTAFADYVESQHVESQHVESQHVATQHVETQHVETQHVEAEQTRSPEEAP